MLKPLCLMFFGTLMLQNLYAQDQNPYEKIKPIKEKMQVLPLGSVKPQGWIKKQIQENLDGFTGHLDSLAPDLIIKDAIYDKNRLTKKVKNKDVGALGNEGDWQVQFLWWNSETQSNWRDGYIRSAILANDTEHLKKIEKYIQHILASQDKDGYLGIYDKELRYKFDNENGELWAQTTLLRGLLAWYEYKNDSKILEAIKRAVANTMKGFPTDSSHPFYSVNPNVGGLSHGLTFTDVLENLYRITNDQQYLDYALFLYKDFSSQLLNEDAQYTKLLQKDLILSGHGVHTYEHLRSLAAAVYASGNPQLLTALGDFIEKIKLTTTATGGPVGDEWIASPVQSATSGGGKKADATTRGYEYCSLQELMHSYESLFAKTSNPDFGNKVEKLFFNAAQGARHPEESCIAYLKSDNSYAMTGGLNGDESDAKQTRYHYSPVHKEAAVCCVPNAGRIAPYYVSYMWMKQGNSIAAALLGPCELQTSIDDKSVNIREVTDYPYGNTITFQIETSADFTFRIRMPEWALKMKVNVPYKRLNGYIIIPIKVGKINVSVEFFPEVKTQQDNNGEYFFSYGSLILAHPIDADVEKTKTYDLPGFRDLEYKPKDLVVYQYKNPAAVKSLGNLKFETSLFNPKKGKEEPITLVPIGETILRQTTFKPN